MKISTCNSTLPFDIFFLDVMYTYTFAVYFKIQIDKTIKTIDL